MKLHKLFLLAGLAVSMLACKKEDMVGRLGNSTTGEVVPEVRVTLNTRRPALGDSVVLTTSTWHKSDKITKVEYLATQYDEYGINLSLRNTILKTYTDSVKNLIVVDTLQSNEPYFSVSAENKELDKYYVTESNNYVVRGAYKDFAITEIKDADLINSLPAEVFELLKTQLAVAIKVADYALLFPTAPNENYTIVSGAKTGISTLGKTYLIENLTADKLNTILLEATKAGSLKTTLTVRVSAQKSAKTEVVNEFETAY
jgi:hypothetical protein